MSTLKEDYLNIVIPKLITKFKYTNKHQVPTFKKIVINAGLGLNAQNKLFLQKAIEEFRLISGQHPIIKLAKKSIANFKLRTNVPLGLLVTLRRKKMYAFLEKLIKIVLPRIQDFHGLSQKSFDNYGNYNFGISDQLIFPEIKYENVEQKRGFNISIITTAKTNSEGFFLLKKLGFPFKL